MPHRLFTRLSLCCDLTSALRSLLASVFLLLSVAALAQFEVQNAENPPFDPQRLIEDVFLGEGVEVVSIQFDGPTEALGYFKDAAGPIGIEEGILLTTGLSKTNSSGKGANSFSEEQAQYSNNSTVTDPNLTQIVPNNANGTSNLFDVSRYTITFIPKGDHVRFRYAFASEEYPEFVCSNYNDVFGFFLDGPGLSGPYQNGGVNLARIPGTNLPVTINSINPGVHGSQGSPTGCDPPAGTLAYSVYYRDNTTPGQFPIYDGMTQVLTAEADVVPCQTYTMQITIGDVGDASYDSGVFLEAKSFSTPTLSVEVATLSLAGEVAEGCTPGEFIFRVNEASGVDRVIPYTVGGTATPGVDYAALSGTVVLPAGAMQVSVPVQAYVDGMTETAETIDITVAVDVCSTRTVTLRLVDRAIPPATLVLDTIVCPGAAVPLEGTLPTAVDMPITFENRNSAFISTPNDPIFRDINVSGITPIVLQGGLVVNVCVDIQHNRTEDLDLYLYSPDGKYIELSSDNGGLSPGGYDRACFRSDAIQPINDISLVPPFTGDFLPEGSWSELWDGDANSADGIWRLQIVDDENGASGVFLGWDITFAPIYTIDYTWTPSAGLSCDDCPNPLATPTGTTTYTLDATDSYGCTETSTIQIAHFAPAQAPVISCSPGFDEITWNWNTDSTINGYEVRVDGGAWIDVGTTTTYTETGLGFNQTVTLEVRASGGCDTAVASSSCATQNCSAYSLTASYADASCGGASDGEVTLTPGGGVAPYTYINGLDTNTTGTFTGLSAGTYTASVVDANGCTGSTTYVVGEPTRILTAIAVAIPIGCGGAYLIDASGSSGAGGPYTYSWSDGQTGSSATFADGGTYYIDVTDANGCILRDTFMLPVIEPLIANWTAQDVSCFSGSDGTLSATVAGGEGPYSYSIGSGFGASNTFTNLSAGSYTLTVQDNMGCTADTSITLAEPTAFTVALTASSTSCNSDSDGAIISSTSGGSGPLSYLWSNGETLADLTGLAAGIYTLTVTDSLGCSTSNTATVVEPGVLSMSLAVTDVACFGESSGELQISTLGGTAPFTFTWSDGLVSIDSLRTGLSAGTYSVSLQDANGCSLSSASATVAQPSPLTALHTAQPVTCAGTATGAIDLSVSGGVGPYSFSWSDGDTNEDRSGLAAGQYAVIITDAQGCEYTYSLSLDAPAPLVVAVSSVDVTCFGYANGSMDITASGGEQPYTYHVLGPNGYEFFGANPQQLDAGSYTAELRDAYGCTFDTVIAIVEPVAITLSTTPGDTICFGGSNGRAAVQVTGGTAPFNYQWDNAEARDSAFSLTAGTHSVEVTDANGCAFTQTVEIASLPQLSLILGESGVLCYGDSNGVASVVEVMYGNDSRAISGLIYTWDGQAANTGTSYDSLGGTQNVQVFAVDDRGCTASNDITISSPAELRAETNKLNDLSCKSIPDGAARVEVMGGTAAYNYQWLVATTTPTAQSALDLPEGTHRVAVTDANGCVDTTEVTLLAPDSLLTSIDTKLVNCEDVRSGAATVSPRGGTSPYSYQWSTGSTDDNIFRQPEGDYTVVVTDANGCTRLDTAMIATASEVSLNAAATDVTCHGDRDGAIALEAAGGNGPYQYSISGVSYSNQSQYRYLTPGEYYAIAEDRDGCPSDTMYLRIGEPQPLIVEAGEEVEVELGSSTQLRAQTFNEVGDVDYLWMPADTSLFDCATCPSVRLTPTFQGMISVQIIDSRGCEAEDFVRVRITKSLQVAVPTGFTPNGDGKDDLLVVHGKSGTEVATFTVFDRWGDVVYSDGGFQVNNLNRGWDGRVGGQYAAGGVYVWQLTVQYLDGISETFSGQTTLVR